MELVKWIPKFRLVLNRLTDSWMDLLGGPITDLTNGLAVNLLAAVNLNRPHDDQLTVRSPNALAEIKRQ